MTAWSQIQLVGGIVAACGCVAVAADLVPVVRSLASGRWPVVDGEILWSGVESHDELRGSYEVPLMTPVFRPVVRYSYRLGERTYTSERVQFGRLLWESPRFAEQITRRYTKGQVVKVHVSPRDRNESVLDPGIHMYHLVRLARGALFVGLGLALTSARVGAYLSGPFP